MKRFVIGDIHGGYRALLQCLERSNFNKEKDLLITIGDICDGWSETYECVEELLTIKNRIDIRGNHDWWLVDWFKFKTTPYIWTSQGGEATLNSYFEVTLDDEVRHFNDFFNKQVYYYVDDKNRLFVHGGYHWGVEIQNQRLNDLMWDRHLYETACYWEAQNKLNPTNPIVAKDYKEIFIGHTATTYTMNRRIGNSIIPHHVSNVWNVDQGGGWDGKLSIMNIDTKKFWQSDLVNTLYPYEKGR